MGSTASPPKGWEQLRGCLQGDRQGGGVPLLPQQSRDLPQVLATESALAPPTFRAESRSRSWDGPCSAEPAPGITPALVLGKLCKRSALPGAQSGVEQ